MATSSHLEVSTVHDFASRERVAADGDSQQHTVFS